MRFLAVQREAPALHGRAHCRMATAWILGSPPPLRSGFRPRMTKGRDALSLIADVSPNDARFSRDGGYDADVPIRGIGKGGADVAVKRLLPLELQAFELLVAQRLP